MEIRLPIRDLAGGDEPFNFVRVSVGYDKGGMSYATYKQKPRCFYLSVVPVRVHEGIQSCVLDFGATGRGGGRMVLEEAKRDSKKRMAELGRDVEDQIARQRGGAYEFIVRMVQRARCELITGGMPAVTEANCAASTGM